MTDIEIRETHRVHDHAASAIVRARMEPCKDADVLRFVCECGRLHSTRLMELTRARNTRMFAATLAASRSSRDTRIPEVETMSSAKSGTSSSRERRPESRDGRAHRFTATGD